MKNNPQVFFYVMDYSDIKEITRLPFQQEQPDLYYFNARYYDATIGRFINVDPLNDGTNWYVYVSNNPMNQVDPTGLEAITASGVAIGIAVVATAVTANHIIQYNFNSKYREACNGFANELGNQLKEVTTTIFNATLGKILNKNRDTNKARKKTRKNRQSEWNRQQNKNPKNPGTKAAKIAIAFEITRRTTEIIDSIIETKKNFDNFSEQIKKMEKKTSTDKTIIKNSEKNLGNKEISPMKDDGDVNSDVVQVESQKNKEE